MIRSLLFSTFWISLTFAYVPIIYEDTVAAKLYTEISKVKKGNLVFSPAPLVDVLALVYFGARGATAREIQSKFNLPEDPEEILAGFKRTKRVLFHENNPFVLRLANKVYLKQGYKAKSYFTKIAEVFNADVANVNFAKSKAAAKKINKWVEAKTEKRIKDLVSSKDLNADTDTVLVNALYFKGNWLENFVSVGKRYFFADGTSKRVLVDAMKLDRVLNHCDIKEIDASLLEVPLQGTDFTFTIVVPKKVDGLSKIEKNIYQSFMECDSPPRYMSLIVPKFKISKKIDIKPILQKLNVTTMFSDEANFSGMVKKPVKVDKILQKSHISINDNGVEGAASKGFRKSGPVPGLVFQVDRPFFFYITLKENILFVGRILNPLVK